MSDPVRFSDAVDLLRREGVQTYLELGPGEVLARMIDGYPQPAEDDTDRTPAVLHRRRDRRVLPGG
ncbi:hypothetical protein ACFU53_46655 [Streptomyces sp. NPDC057474]|uniref:hypothetical protein n=1 Tax=Streptomyces sp. NPDC057474 TaxID=3346144 RepID=UPI0036891B16